MIKQTFVFISLFLLPCYLQGQVKHLPEINTLPAHPRILLLEGEEKAIRANIAAEPIWGKAHQSIVNECERIIDLPVLESVKTGKRLLSVSREALRRIFYLSYAYRIDNEAKYMRRAEKEMLAVAAFETWNPSHFLDVAEMTIALSIGYDWLYNVLSPASREIIQTAILRKGIDPSLNSKDAWFPSANHNWNQVCNAGISYGALAIFEDMPELSKLLLTRAIETIQLTMKAYGPDGAYAEGYGYWEYGTSFNVLFLSAIEKIFREDFGLSELSGFMKTAAYEENMTGPFYSVFNYSDNGFRGGLSTSMFWFASKLKDTSLLWNEKHYLETEPFNLGNRLLPTLIIWGSHIRMNEIRHPDKQTWVGHGITPVALMRTSWTDSAAIFVGIKGGTASSNHAHIDAGSFVMDAGGVRWASDFGAQEYHSLESKGVDLWNLAQNSQRWQIFRYNNFVHNTLTVDGALHNVNGFADVISHSSKPDFIHSIVDLSEIFKDQLAQSVRGIAIVDNRYVVVRDEIKTLGKETRIRWTMLTTADVSISGKNSFELSKDGKKLKLEVMEPAKINLKTWSTVPPNSYDAPNPGTTLIGFEVTIPADTSAALSVKLIPQGGKKTLSKIPELSQW